MEEKDDSANRLTTILEMLWIDELIKIGAIISNCKYLLSVSCAISMQSILIISIRIAQISTPITYVAIIPHIIIISYHIN